ncbi:MAG: hypothetical protein KIT33_11040 [Candidatus Kapabacteria bacterium]|nr:hypothetical protein [Ignavibacteriota bacterium]MCW5885492.1 hypothetical protein [Candidatus Kapabacteria bacterium]
MFSLRFIIFLLLVILSVSCIQENPDLVNPPDRTASIRFRFLNLGLDKESKVFEITDGKRTQAINWLNLSSADNPPADTGMVRVLNNNNLEFEQSLMVRFLRNTNYTYVGLSSSVCDDRTNCRIDTLIALRTTAAIPENNFESLVKFMNAYPDTNVRFSIRLGCPSGAMLFPPTDYKQYSISPITVRSGEFNFSVIKTVFNGGIPENIYLDLFTADLEPRGQYVIITHEDSNGDVQVSIIDENDLTENAMKPAQVVPMRTTEIRTVNMSSASLSIQLRDDSFIDQNLNGMLIGNYQTVEACKSSALDSIDIFSSGNLKSSIFSSLEVLSKYSIVVFDSADVKAGGSLLVEPLKLNLDVAGRAVIRIINTVEDFDGLNVSVGARLESDLSLHPNGYSSGISLARRLEFAKISSPVVVAPGPAPLSVFTASEPARMLMAMNTFFEADNSYLIIVSNDDMNNLKLSIINDSDENKPVQYLEEGIFFQLVNAVSDNSTAKISITSQATGVNILNDALLHPTSSLATVIDKELQNIVINGQSFEVSANITQRVLMVIGGTENNLNVIHNRFQPLTENQRNIFRVRFVNMTTDLPLAMIKRSNSDEEFIQGLVQYEFSPYNPPETREQKPTFFFYEGTEIPEYVARFSDVTLSLGKSYCIILHGNSDRKCNKYYYATQRVEPNCYSIIFQQEF